MQRCAIEKHEVNNSRGCVSGSQGRSEERRRTDGWRGTPLESFSLSMCLMGCIDLRVWPIFCERRQQHGAPLLKAEGAGVSSLACRLRDSRSDRLEATTTV